MVLKSLILNAARKSGFIDKLRIHVKAGAGGMGNPRFEGTGGKGGDVYILANEHQTLQNLVQEFPDKRFTAGVGEDSKARYVFGAPGDDIKIKVPVGVQVLTDQGRLLGDLKRKDLSVLVAQGGAGGCKENQYSGQRGQAHTIILDYKMNSDVGFIGFPSAGKSTLIQAIMKQKTDIDPKSTVISKTIEPQLHTIEYSDYRQITLGDLPGLVRGVHNNLGKGNKYLKHIERTKLLVFVVDVGGFPFSKQSITEAFETIIILNKQLELYKEELVQKPAILVINKMDKTAAKVHCQILMDKLKHIEDACNILPQDIIPRNLIKFDAVIPVSSRERDTVDELKNKLRHFLDINAEIKALKKSLAKN